ncbi:PepSY domain-containing protein [Leeuwenhoekiella sp. NPDC079379]|uniref:PepSY domain-containing protein n=1 Tax=Leeuwenhoekiella sp. NPDC079379 TaxID=3364122 RepID=UPI0037CAA2C4
MSKIRIRKKIRKTHRYLGLFIGVQFIFWTVSGLYFSWTDLDEIHGDHFKQDQQPVAFQGLVSPSALDSTLKIETLALREINGEPYYWINRNLLYNAKTGVLKGEISEAEALKIASTRMLPELKVSGVEKIDQVDKHHEYREKLLPAYVISYAGDETIKAYVSISDGAFQTVRHRNWRWFDFLWMTHTMDYEGRDNINNWLLRAFSILGLVTVLSGFILWYISSPTLRMLRKKK